MSKIGNDTGMTYIESSKLKKKKICEIIKQLFIP